MNKKMIQGLSLLICVIGVSACTPSSVKQESLTAESETVSYNQKAALANVELGLGYLSQGQVARAKSKLTLACKMAPNLSETHSAMAYFNEMVGEIKEAEREHKKAIKLGTEMGGALYNNYGAFLCRQARYQPADQAFNQAFTDKVYPRTAEVYENAGLCALKSSNPEKALTYFNSSHRQDPNRTSVMLELAALQLEHNQLSDAKELLDHYKTLAEPSARSVWLNLKAAQLTQDKSSMTYHAMVLKDLFQDSPEYQLYLKSGKKAS